MSEKEIFMSYDPWANIQSRNGIPGDELVSMLQKSIRRGMEDNALAAAYEMYVTSPQFLEKLWRRLLVISVEDIGFGDPDISGRVLTLYRISKEFPYTDGDQPIFFMHAIRALCRCKKERTTDNIKNQIIKGWEHGQKPEVPDYAYDMHPEGPCHGPGRDALPHRSQPGGSPDGGGGDRAHPRPVYRVL